jgi:hypothetical protein
MSFFLFSLFLSGLDKKEKRRKMGCTTSLFDNASLSTILKPNRKEIFYRMLIDRYFDAMENKVGEAVNYSKGVIRYEHGYGLTGLGNNRTNYIDSLIKQGKCICTHREYLFSEIQPFLRAKVTFFYGNDIQAKKNPTTLYIEFTFNTACEITFIEIWKNSASLKKDEQDWPVITDRISTKIPGLGSVVNSASKAFISLIEKDKDIATLDTEIKGFANKVQTALKSRSTTNFYEVLPAV